MFDGAYVVSLLPRHPLRLQAMALPSPFPILSFLHLQGKVSTFRHRSIVRRFDHHQFAFYVTSLDHSSISRVIDCVFDDYLSDWE